MESWLVTIGKFAPLLMKGTWITIQVWFFSWCISLGLGIVVGIVCCEQTPYPRLAYIVRGAILILQGVPLYTQLLVAYFVLSPLLNVTLSSYTTGILVLGLCSAAYTAEVIRGALNSLDKEQWELGFMLGYSFWDKMWCLMIPQALAISIRSLANESNQVLKSTAILASIGTVELTKVGLNIVAQAINPLVIFSAIAGIYFIITLLLSSWWRWLERRLAC